MNLFNFDLASLFKAPVVTIDESVVDEVVSEYEVEHQEMPGEYMEVETSFHIVTPDVEQEKSIHEKMYELSTSTPTTIELNPIGGSENLQTN